VHEKLRLMPARCRSVQQNVQKRALMFVGSKAGKSFEILRTQVASNSEVKRNVAFGTTARISSSRQQRSVR
jgi:hypothetical protein